MNKKNNLVWIDLEMTGLNPQYDVILEIATIITDSELNIIQRGPSLVVHHAQDIMQRMDSWVSEMHAKSGLTQEVKKSSITLAQAEEQTLRFIEQFCEPQKAPLCGNSVWQDALFLRAYMPKITDFLHYRIVDVSSIKLVINRWYPNNAHSLFIKKDQHRAMIDIEESIEELKQYKRYFFIPTDL